MVKLKSQNDVTKGKKKRHFFMNQETEPAKVWHGHGLTRKKKSMKES